MVYITKNRIWAGEKSFEWNGRSIGEVFSKIKKEFGVNRVRIVFGNDVSYVMAVKTDGNFLPRESVLKLVKHWMPFEVDNECFDWKQVVLGVDEVWLQIVAVRKELLLSLSAAVRNHDICVDLVTAIGVLLGKISIEREAPVVIKWSDREKLLVLAINGLVDLVTSSISEEDMMVYAKHRWGLALNPEEIVLKEGEFNLLKNVFSEKTEGEDGLILNLPILKGVISKTVPGTEEPTKCLSWWRRIVGKIGYGK